MTDIDTVAEAIRQADDFEEVLQTQWADMSDELRDIYRRMAQAAIDALGLTREWVVSSPGAEGWPLQSIEEAKHRLAIAIRDNEVLLKAGGEVSDVYQNPRIGTRLVSAWVRVEDQRETQEG